MHQIEEIRKAGGFAFALYPSGWLDFVRFVDNLKNDRFTEDMPVIIKQGRK